MCSSRKYPPYPSRRATDIYRGGGFKRRQFPRGWVIVCQVFFPGAPSKIDEQAISYYTVNRFFKAKIIVFKGRGHFLIFFWREGATLLRIITWLLCCEGISLRASSLGARAPTLKLSCKLATTTINLFPF